MPGAMQAACSAHGPLSFPSDSAQSQGPPASALVLACWAAAGASARSRLVRVHPPGQSCTRGLRPESGLMPETRHSAGVTRPLKLGHCFERQEWFFLPICHAIHFNG